MYDVYAAVKEDAKKRKAVMSREAPRNEKGQIQQLPELIPAVAPASERETRTIRAKMARTNPKYIDLADKLLEEQPENPVQNP